jgi:DNA-directed RNA polymerase II subunit RPB11
MEIERNSNLDHTLIFEEQGSVIGNMLQKELLRNSEVKYAGYIVPHPLEKKMKVRVITKTVSPKDVLNEAFTNLQNQLNDILLSIDKEIN